MKKLILVFAMIFAIGFTVTSCKDEKKKEEKKEITTSVYQCPMDCENGKSYTQAGKCPECKMPLKEKKVSMEKNHDGHAH